MKFDIAKQEKRLETVLAIVSDSKDMNIKEEALAQAAIFGYACRIYRQAQKRGHIFAIPTLEEVILRLAEITEDIAMGVKDDDSIRMNGAVAKVIRKLIKQGRKQCPFCGAIRSEWCICD